MGRSCCWPHNRHSRPPFSQKGNLVSSWSTPVRGRNNSSSSAAFWMSKLLYASDVTAPEDGHTPLRLLRSSFSASRAVGTNVCSGSFIKRRIHLLALLLLA